MDARTLQEMADDFNLKYNQACVTSKPVDWGQAALSARQMVNAMCKRGIINDSLPELMKNNKQD